MEATRKRRGFIKSRLPLSFHRGAKPSIPMQYSSKVNPSRSSPMPPVEYSFPPAKQKSAFMKMDGSVDQVRGTTNVGQENGDDSVDKKAENYISYVQERFKLERVNSDRRKLEEIQARVILLPTRDRSFSHSSSHEYF
ncbi:hypothetical protein H6P81_012057 [Aristolochia fimbriata]|uniref:Uncharacterized protein n=1 Tax=Aristolochia fimbriata TaxID=158543 RepID=A0AAV7ECE2_ARIFI|nr:hypothetical protein H6P81_012057 [Aristolochia fimbriata]